MSCKVLVVDDEYDMLQAICGILTDEGYQAQGCGDGQAALECSERSDFSLAVVDVMMPGLDGLQLLTKLRALPGQSNLPVLLVSAAPLPAAHRAAGFDGFLPKPFDIDGLLNAVKRLLAARKQKTGRFRTGRGSI